MPDSQWCHMPVVRILACVADGRLHRADRWGVGELRISLSFIYRMRKPSGASCLSFSIDSVIGFLFHACRNSSVARFKVADVHWVDTSTEAFAPWLCLNHKRLPSSAAIWFVKKKTMQIREKNLYFMIFCLLLFIQDFLLW